MVDGSPRGAIQANSPRAETQQGYPGSGGCAGGLLRCQPPRHRLGTVAHSIYICSAEGNAGKSTVALGTIDTLSRRATRVGVFRPIARSTEERDYVLELLLAHEGVIDLSYDEEIGVGYDEVHADPEAALSTIVRRF